MSSRNSTHEGVRRIALDNLGKGSLTIEPNARADLVECSIEADAERFLEEVQVKPEHAGLRLTFPPESHRGTTAHVRLGVPEDLEYAVTVGSADVTIRAIIGPSKITSGSGSIRVGHATDLECSSGSGNISVASVAGRAARLVSGSGDITVNEAQCPVSAKCGSGRVTVKWAHHHHVQVNSGCGDIAVNRTRGAVDLRTA